MLVVYSLLWLILRVILAPVLALVLIDTDVPINEQQMNSLEDYVEASLMLQFNRVQS